jgi:hypothetical protein
LFRQLQLIGKEHEKKQLWPICEKFMLYSVENCEQHHAHHTNSLQTDNNASTETNNQLMRKTDIT